MTPCTFSIYPCPLSVHVVMLSIQAVRGLPRLRAPGIVPCFISSTGNSNCFLMVWPYASFLAVTVSNSPLFTPALLRTHSFVYFAVHETRSIFLSPFISKVSRRVSSFFFWESSFHSAATGHTSAFISRIFVEIVMLWLNIHIFCSEYAQIACLLFNLVRNSVVHSPSSAHH